MSADWQAFWTSWQCDVWLTLMLLLTAGIYTRGWFRLRARGVRYFGPWQLASIYSPQQRHGVLIEPCLLQR